MLIDDWLPRLCCPETRQPLVWASPELVDQLNRQIALGRLVNRSGQTVSLPLEGGLLRADRLVVFPIREQLPVLIIDEAIPLCQ